MADADTESADADTDSEERTEYAWASQTPTSRVEGEPTGLIYAGRLDDSVAQNNTSFGVVYEEPEVVDGELFVNEAKPSDGTMKDVVDEESSVPTDYRIADPDDTDASFDRDGNFKTDEESTVEGESANTYEEADGFDEDAIIVWYNGLAGERLARTLDFNGRPFARWTDDGYLVKGLVQPAEGWREARGSERSDMKEAGKAPRVARAPILRQRVEIEYDDEGDVEDATLHDDANGQRIVVDISRFQGGRAYEVHAFDADQFSETFGSVDATIPRTDEGYAEDDIDSELDMPYTPAADSILEQAEYSMHMYTGADGWQDEPDDWQPSSTSAVGSFGVSADAGGDEAEDSEGLTAAQEQFVREVVDELKGTGMGPEEAFEGGLAGLIGKFSDQFDRVPEEAEVREEVYARVAHLDVDSLDE